MMSPVLKLRSPVSWPTKSYSAFALIVFRPRGAVGGGGGTARGIIFVSVGICCCAWLGAEGVG
ncbi:hypothetical protein A0J61_05655 [Choanephora cucurbitarum]|uniref:Uncharacterized protein n=1 Tax=Choanephora cucurbitarum TaxID=101091 RepID=A0A1C7NB82_9FUNG|nr:hypothetical protein A0J61_05655 [Choanephora cucurbitarum]